MSLCNHCSEFAPVHSGVPQGSVLGPMLFTMYIKPLSAIIDSHSIIHHSFADDLQLQMFAPPDRISELLHSMQSCISDVKAWATANMLKLHHFYCHVINVLPQSNTLLPVCSYTRTELLSLRTKTSLLSLSIVDRLKDLNIGYHLPRRHRSSRGVKRKKPNLHSFIAASFNAQSVKGNDMACKRCEISTFIKDNGVDLFL